VYCIVLILFGSLDGAATCLGRQTVLHPVWVNSRSHLCQGAAPDVADVELVASRGKPVSVTELERLSLSSNCLVVQ
jgi:hypothetical protein